jgi:dienelactone hydrolase
MSSDRQNGQNRVLTKLVRIDITGNTLSKKAIVDVYDVFGPASQTLQGADALAEALGILVVVPDFFKGEPAQTSVCLSLPPFSFFPKFHPTSPMWDLWYSIVEVRG